MDEFTIQVGPLLWTCPGCDHGNEAGAQEMLHIFEPGQPGRCAACGTAWAYCPNEDCAGGGEDCPICGGQTGGLVRLESVHA